MSLKLTIKDVAFFLGQGVFTRLSSSLGICHQLKIRHLYGTISRPIVFVREREACLPTVFVAFMDMRALYEGKPDMR